MTLARLAHWIGWTGPPTYGPRAKDLKLPAWTLAIALLPWGVLSLAGYLLNHYGMPAANMQLTLVPDGQLEAGARLRMLATWLLLAAVALACLCVFVLDLLRLERNSRWLLLAAWAFFVAVGVGGAAMNEARGRAEHAIGEQMICRSLLLADVPKTVGKPIGPLPASSIREGQRDRCASVSKFGWFDGLNRAQLFLLLLVLPALVLGAISCLAGLPDQAALQIGRLNTYMYLAAALLVCGLLFLSALLRWPSYAFRGADVVSYVTHVSDYVLFWGVTYTVVIGSYYLPVALVLAGTVPPAAEADADGESDRAAVLRPWDMLKVAAGVFAPAIAGLIGEIVKV